MWKLYKKPIILEYSIPGITGVKQESNKVGHDYLLFWNKEHLYCIQDWDVENFKEWKIPKKGSIMNVAFNDSKEVIAVKTSKKIFSRPRSRTKVLHIDKIHFVAIMQT